MFGHIFPRKTGVPGSRPGQAFPENALIRQPGAEHRDGVEIQLGVEAALDVATLAEAMLLAGEQEIADGLAATAERRNHSLGLVGWDNGVFVALEKDHRFGQAIGMGDRRAVAVERFVVWIGTNEPVEIARLELVGVARKCRDVADTIIAR